MNISKQQIMLFFLVLAMSLFFVFVNYIFVLSITSWLTAQEQSKDIPYFQNIEKINSVLIKTDSLKEVSKNSVKIYDTLKIIFLILVISTVALFVPIRKIISDSKKTIELFVPKWKIVEHSKIMIPAAIGIFVAISLSYFSSLSYISLLRRQTIVNTIALSLDTKQPEILNNLLITYMQNNLSEYWITTSGFLYFLFALIFPILGSVWYYYRKKELSFWIIVLFTCAAFTVPIWILISI